MAPTDRCQCGDVQTMIHIVKSCPLTRFADGDLFRLNSADDGAVTWLQDVAVKALAK